MGRCHLSGANPSIGPNPLVEGSNPSTPAELGFPYFRNSDLENKVVLQSINTTSGTERFVADLLVERTSFQVQDLGW